MSISTRTRFEIFKRDGFRCSYCGSTPQQSILHVDHVEAVANGGTDDPSNLVTACDRCNLGKSDVPLEHVPLAVEEPENAAARTQERTAQLKAYLAAQRELAAVRESIVDEALAHWEERVRCFNVHRQLPGTMRRALDDDFDLSRVLDAINIVASKSQHDLRGAESQYRYFCAVLRNWREG